MEELALGAQAGACFALSASACRAGFLLSPQSRAAAPAGLAAAAALTTAGVVAQTRGMKDGAAMVVFFFVRSFFWRRLFFSFKKKHGASPTDAASRQLLLAHMLAHDATAPSFECNCPGCGKHLKHATALRLHEHLHAECDLSPDAALVEDSAEGLSACGEAVQHSRRSAAAAAPSAACSCPGTAWAPGRALCPSPSSSASVRLRPRRLAPVRTPLRPSQPPWSPPALSEPPLRWSRRV
jgi:hypothetical protein